MAQLSAWQDYAAHKLYLHRILIPLTAKTNIRILPGKTGVVSLTLQPNKTSFTPRHTIIGKGVAYVKPLDPSLPLRTIEIEFEITIVASKFTILQTLQYNFYRDKKWHILMPGLRA